jgi:hypothetical protein
MRAAAKRLRSNRRANAEREGAPAWSAWLKDIAGAAVLVFGFFGVAAYFGLFSVPTAIGAGLGGLSSRLLTRVIWRAKHGKQAYRTDDRSETG